MARLRRRYDPAVMAGSSIVRTCVALVPMACSIPAPTERAGPGNELAGRAAPSEVEITLTLVDPLGRDVIPEALGSDAPRTLYLWRDGDVFGSDPRPARFGVPIRIESPPSVLHVQLAPEEEERGLLRDGWGLADDPSPRITLEPGATGARRIMLSVAPKRRIGLTWKLPDDVTSGPEPSLWVVLVPAVGRSLRVDFDDRSETPTGTLVQQVVDVPVGRFDLWATARAGEEPRVGLWAHEVLQISDHEKPQSFLVNFKRGVRIEGRFVDRRDRPVTARDDVSWFDLAPSGMAARSYGPPFHRVTYTLALWTLSPDLHGCFEIGGLPPVTELSLGNTRTKEPPRISTPRQGGHVGDIVVRDH